MKRRRIVYVLINPHRSVLNTSVMEDLRKRIFEHKTQAIDGFRPAATSASSPFTKKSADDAAAIARVKLRKAGS